MNETDGSLESELASLRPVDASVELRQRIAGHRHHVRTTRSRWRWTLGLAGGLAAAVTAAIVLQRPDGRSVEPNPIAVGREPQPVPVESSGPTLLAYQRALARSPEELDALLNIHAVAAPEPDPAHVRVCAFTRSDSVLSTFLGDN